MKKIAMIVAMYALMSVASGCGMSAESVISGLDILFSFGPDRPDPDDDKDHRPSPPQPSPADMKQGDPLAEHHRERTRQDFSEPKDPRKETKAWGRALNDNVKGGLSGSEAIRLTNEQLGYPPDWTPGRSAPKQP